MSTRELKFQRPSAHTIGMTNSYDVICIGAGPTGLACAIEARREGMRPLVIDKGCLCNSLFHYPINLLFFTTPERMEIGDLPMTISGGKPTRGEALKYLRTLAEARRLTFPKRDNNDVFGQIKDVDEGLGCNG